MNIEIEIGETLLIPTPPKNKHLYIIIAEEIEENKFLMVNITTLQKYTKTDNQNIIFPNEKLPDFIFRKSIIDYRFARIMIREKIIREIKEEIFEKHGKISKKRLTKIQYEGMKSKRLKLKYKKILEKQIVTQDIALVGYR